MLNKHNEIFEKLLLIKANNKPRIILDEIHKFKDWKNLVKGFYDKFGDSIEFIITGSAKLNIYKKDGDSLMGRYINLTVHPLSVAEISKNFSDDIEYIANPKNIRKDEFDALINFGGFAEVYLKGTTRFYRIWSKQRFEQLFREDVRNTEDINNIYNLELLATIINEQVGALTNYTNLANKVRASDQTIRRWLSLLEKHYYCFSIRPWAKNVVRSLIKEPKYYLWDWSQIKDSGAKFENLIASHLLKAVYFWNESGLGDFSLCYLRDKQKQEVDFVIIKDDKPWILVEAKVSDLSISPSLKYFHELLKPEFSFQVVQNKQAIDSSCFDKPGLWIVPAITFLSQLK
ncbi:MAG: AAA family ATPase [Rickettsia endosymbiont of Stiretrus anchorago]|nr:AAA family ATPase [Rickettsia endosymbiont of Stiretrus anchorago]